MMATSRRDALLLGAGMALVAVATAVAKTPRATGVAAPRLDLAAIFPTHFSGWREDEASKAFVRPPEMQGKAYGIYDQLLERTFIDAGGDRIMLSVVFGGDQSTSFQLHRPEGCYESGGFEVDGVRSGTLVLAGRAVPVTRLRAVKPMRSEPITYWTVLGGEAVAGRVRFRLKRIFSGLGAQQSLAGLLVRVSSIDADTERAYALQARFAADLAAALAPPSRDEVLGRAQA